MTEVK